MPIGLFLMVFFFLVIASSTHSSRIEKDVRTNTRNGQIEYLISWYIFREEIVPEVYAAYMKSPDYSYYSRSMGFYDKRFADIGVKLYGRSPVAEASVRAKHAMHKLGYHHYVDTIAHHPDSFERYSEFESLHAKPEKIWYQQYRRPDITFQLYNAEPISVMYNGRELTIPAEDDYRREFYVRCGNKTPTRLKSSHDFDSGYDDPPETPYDRQMRREQQMMDNFKKQNH